MKGFPLKFKDLEFWPVGVKLDPICSTLWTFRVIYQFDQFTLRRDYYNLSKILSPKNLLNFSNRKILSKHSRITPLSKNSIRRFARFFR